MDDSLEHTFSCVYNVTGLQQPRLSLAIRCAADAVPTSVLIV